VFSPKIDAWRLSTHTDFKVTNASRGGAVGVTTFIRFVFILCFVFCGLSCLFAASIPFVFDPITSADAGRPVRVSMDGDVAALIEVGNTRDGGGSTNNVRTYFRTNATEWVELNMLPGSGKAYSIDVDNCRMAVGLVGTARVWTINCANSKPTWTVDSSVILSNAQYRVTDVDLDGSRLAMLVNKTGSALGGDNQIVFVFDQVGSNWVRRAELGVLSTSTLFGASLNADALDLHGDRIAIAASGVNTIQIHERNQGGADLWGRVASISNQPPGMMNLGYSLALDGTRLAAASINVSNDRPHVLVYSNNTGGVNNWGYAGELLHQPAGAGWLYLDTDDGRLAVLGLPVLSSIFEVGKPAQFWIYQSGAGPAGWVLEKTRSGGNLNWNLLELINHSLFSLPGPSLSGTRLMVGISDTNTYQNSSGWYASFHSVNQGGAGQWGHEFGIESPGFPGEFGFSVDMDGSFMVAGMPFDTWAGTDSGSAYVWFLNDSGGVKSWYPVARLVNQNGESNHLFGFDVSITQTDDFEARVAVSSYGEFVDKGAVYIFEVNALQGQVSLPHRITPFPYPTNIVFGWSIALNDTSLAVGAPYSDISGANGGAVYLFEKDYGGTNTWSCRKTNAAPNSGQFFGTKVDLNDQNLIVARVNPVGNGPAVFAYRRDQGGANNWGLYDAVYPPPGSPNGFGWSLDLLGIGSSFAVGAIESFTTNSGKVYLYTQAPSGTNYQPFLTVNDPNNDGSTFGFSVAWMDFGGLVVGARGGGANTGGIVRLYTFALTNGMTNVVLQASMQGSNALDRLGYDVAASMFYAVGSAPRNDGNGGNAGAIYTMRVGSYEIWAGAQPMAFAAAWRPWENYDGDLDANLLEFAMGTDPMNSGSNSRIHMFLHRSSGQTNMAWIKPSLPYNSFGLDYNLQSTDHAASWSAPVYTTVGTNTSMRLFNTFQPSQLYRLAPRYPIYSIEDDIIIIVP